MTALMTHGSLFSGIGGFDLAASWAGIETLWQVEKDAYCRAVLKKHFPNAKRYEDIHEVKGTNLEPVDIISGGPPCQPISSAGKRRGAKDDRWLWPQAIAVVEKLRPSWCLFENPIGILEHLEFKSLLAALEDIGYEVWPVIIPASAVNAFHRRYRVWILAYFKYNRRSTERNKQQTQRTDIHPPSCQTSSDPAIQGLPDWSGGTVGRPFPVTEFERPDGREVERDFRGMVHGVSDRVDRIRALGNAIVPQVAFQIFKAISALVDQKTLSPLNVKPPAPSGVGGSFSLG